MNRPYLNGMGYVYDYTRAAVPPETAAALMERMNVQSARVWHDATWVMRGSDEIDPEEAARYHDMYARLRAHGVKHIVAMNGGWFLPKGAPAPGEQASRNGKERVAFARVPRRDDPLYLIFLDLYEETWRRLAAEFPEVDAWETGNEMNHKPFMKPLHTKDGADCFTLSERIANMCDLMFRATRGIRAVNPRAVAVMPGLAPVGERGEGVVADKIEAEYDGMSLALQMIYDNIRAGSFGSKNPRDFFDALCWHPYYARQFPSGEWKFMRPDAEWVKINAGVYAVAAQNGDPGPDVYLSEFGYNDWGSDLEDARLSDYLAEGVRLTREQMPFVACLTVYRLFPHLAGTTDPDEYALYRAADGGLIPKRRAFAVQRAFGGDGPLIIE